MSLRRTWTPDSCHIFWLVWMYLIRILGELSDLTDKNTGCPTKFVSQIHSESFLKGEYIPNISWDILILNMYSLLIWNAKVTGNLCFIWQPLFQEIVFLYLKALISCCASMKPSYSPSWTPNVAESLTAEQLGEKPCFPGSVSDGGLLVTFHLQMHKGGQNINTTASLHLESENH